MISQQQYDVAIVGGGIMGATVALHLAKAGQNVVLFERRAGLCMEASSANTGALMLQLIRAAFIPFALRSLELWESAPQWLGYDMGFRRNGGLTLAFNEHETELLTDWMAARRKAGAPIEIIDRDRARALEANLTEDFHSASYCPLDGYADAKRCGEGYRRALDTLSVHLRCEQSVQEMAGGDAGYRLQSGRDSITAKRLVLTGGAWLGRLLAKLDCDIPVECRVNQVAVTERMDPIMDRSICAATGRLSLKQSKEGTVLIGGGWQGGGDLDRGGVEIIPEHLTANLRLACHAVPTLRKARLLRSWLGLEAKVMDYMPIMGSVPGHNNAWVLGAVHAGYTLGPILGKILAQVILDEEPDLAIPDNFNPARLLPENRSRLEVW